MSALKEQVGGDYYKKLKIQPVEFAMANDYDPCAFSVLKYVTRYADKDGVKDLQKAAHFVDLRVATLRSYNSPNIGNWKPIKMNRYCIENNLSPLQHSILNSLEAWVSNPSVQDECVQHIKAGIQKLIDDSPAVE